MCPADDPPGFCQVEHRPPQGRGRRGRALQGGDGPARQGAAAEPQLRRAPTPTSTSVSVPFAVNTELREWDAPRRRSPRRRERLRLRRHQLPRRGRGVRARARTWRPGEAGCLRAVDVPQASTTAPERGAGAAPPPMPRVRGAFVVGRRPTTPTLAAGSRGRPTAADGGATPPAAAPDAGRPRARRARRHRLRRRRRARRQGAPRRSRPSEPTTRRCGRRCGRKASSAAAARAGKVAFLYTGQGSQYVNMLATLREPRADRGRDVRRGRPSHDAAARASR